MAKGFSKGGGKSFAKPGGGGSGFRMGGGGRSFRSHRGAGGNAGGSWFGMGSSGRSWSQAARPSRPPSPTDAPDAEPAATGSPVDAFGLAQDVAEAAGWLGNPWLRWGFRLALVAVALWIVLRAGG